MGLNKLDKKYKAIACGLVEQLSKNGLNVEESIFTLKVAIDAYERAASVTVPELQELLDQLI